MCPCRSFLPHLPPLSRLHVRLHGGRLVSGRKPGNSSVLELAPPCEGLSRGPEDAGMELRATLRVKSRSGRVG